MIFVCNVNFMGMSIDSGAVSSARVAIDRPAGGTAMVGALIPVLLTVGIASDTAYTLITANENSIRH